VSLIWRLRRVSRAWKKSVAMTLEWAALEMVRINSPGYIRFLKERREHRLSLQERVEDELRSITVLLSECLVEYSPQSEKVRSKPGSHEQDDEALSLTGGSVEVVCACMWTGFPCTLSGEICSYSASDSGQSEREGFERTNASSTGSSLRACFSCYQLKD
jgi:hypothetical protein